MVRRGVLRGLMFVLVAGVLAMAGVAGAQPAAGIDTMMQNANDKMYQGIAVMQQEQRAKDKAAFAKRLADQPAEAQNDTQQSLKGALAGLAEEERRRIEMERRTKLDPVMIQQEKILHTCIVPSSNEKLPYIHAVKAAHNDQLYELLLYEDEAHCLVDTNKVAIHGTPAEVEMEKLATWARIIKVAPVYLSRTKVLFSNRYLEKEQETILGIKIKTPAADVLGLDAVGKKWTVYSFDDDDKTGIEYTTYRRPLDAIPVVKTYDGNNLVNVEKMTDKQADSTVKKNSETGTGFFANLGRFAGEFGGRVAAGNGYAKPTPKAVTISKRKDVESVIYDFGGIRVSDINYVFDTTGYVGFTAKIADRESFTTTTIIPPIIDVFTALTKYLGQPTAMLKSGDYSVGKNADGSDFAARVWSEGVWISKNGLRVDVHCEDPDNKSKTCYNGRVQVRDLSALPVKAEPTKTAAQLSRGAQ